MRIPNVVKRYGVRNLTPAKANTPIEAGVRGCDLLAMRIHILILMASRRPGRRSSEEIGRGLSGLHNVFIALMSV